MKPSLLLFLWVVTQAGSFGQNSPTAPNAADLAAAAQEFFAAIRSGVGNSIEETLKSERVGARELDAILTSLKEESNKLHCAAVDAKLGLAARQVEIVRTQVVTLLKDPANKAMAAGLDPQEWLDRIALQRSVGKILEGDMERLGCALGELRRWASLVEPVAPPDQISNGLRTRLAELLKEWRGNVGGASSLPVSEASLPRSRGGKMSPELADKMSAPQFRTRSDAPGNRGNNPGGNNDVSQSVTLESRTGSGVPVFTLIRLSPSVAAVLKLARTGAAEDQILTFIDRCPSAIALDADQIISIQSQLSSAVICRMLQHDGALRANIQVGSIGRAVGSGNIGSAAVSGRPGNAQR